jgi:hypothetical protein
LPGLVFERLTCRRWRFADLRFLCAKVLVAILPLRALLVIVRASRRGLVWFV